MVQERVSIRFDADGLTRVQRNVRKLADGLDRLEDQARRTGIAADRAGPWPVPANGGGSPAGGPRGGGPTVIPDDGRRRPGGGPDGPTVIPGDDRRRADDDRRRSGGGPDGGSGRPGGGSGRPGGGIGDIGGIGGGIAAAIGADRLAGAIVSDAEMQRAINYIGLAADATEAEIEAIKPRLVKLADDMKMDKGAVLDGFDALVAEGLSLREAYDFMPTVLRGAQGTNAEPRDLAKTLLGTARQFGVASGEPLEGTLDIIARLGQAGSFEVPELAAELPELLNLMAGAGYSGNEGIAELGAYAQTLRTGTATSGEAATQLRDLLLKYNAPVTANAAENNLDFAGYEAALQARIDAGMDALDAAVDLAWEITGGQADQLIKLYADKESNLAMRTLFRARTDGTLERFRAEAEKAAGTIDTNLDLILDDAESNMQQLRNLAAKPVAYIAEMANRAIDIAEGIATGEAAFGETAGRSLDFLTESPHRRALAALAEYAIPSLGGGGVDQASVPLTAAQRASLAQAGGPVVPAPAPQPAPVPEPAPEPAPAPAPVRYGAAGDPGSDSAPRAPGRAAVEEPLIRPTLDSEAFDLDVVLARLRAEEELTAPIEATATLDAEPFIAEVERASASVDRLKSNVASVASIALPAPSGAGASVRRINRANRRQFSTTTPGAGE